MKKWLLERLPPLKKKSWAEHACHTCTIINLWFILSIFQSFGQLTYSEIDLLIHCHSFLTPPLSDGLFSHCYHFLEHAQIVLKSDTFYWCLQNLNCQKAWLTFLEIWIFSNLTCLQNYNWPEIHKNANSAFYQEN